MSQWRQHSVSLLRKVLPLGLPRLMEPTPYPSRPSPLDFVFGAGGPSSRAAPRVEVLTWKNGDGTGQKSSNLSQR